MTARRIAVLALTGALLTGGAGAAIAAVTGGDDKKVEDAILVLRAETLRILDDRSTNGTFVNGRRVDEAELHDGDVVVLGRVVLTYRDLRAA